MVSKSFATNLDWSRPDDVSDAERESLARWYAETHEVADSANLSLTGFMDFWLTERPDVAKSYRRTIEATAGMDVLPAAAVALLFLHQYVVTANSTGALYEVIAARVWGASRRQVIETLAFAFLHSGPHGMAAATASCGKYLSEWQEDTEGQASWPEGWSTDAAVLHSGINYVDDEFSDADRTALISWHECVEGEVPEYVPFLIDRNPGALKALRYRYEHALRGALPTQMVPLFTLHLAGLRAQPASGRRALHMAKLLEVAPRYIDHTVSLLNVYCGDVSMDMAIRSCAING